MKELFFDSLKTTMFSVSELDIAVEWRVFQMKGIMKDRVVGLEVDRWRRKRERKSLIKNRKRVWDRAKPWETPFLKIF